MKAFPSLLLAASSLTVLMGCNMGPDFSVPALHLPTVWQAQPSSAANNKAQVEQQWWEHFADPVLTRLIHQSLDGNLDIQIAQARISSARAARSYQHADLFPSADMVAGGERQANRLTLGKQAFSKPFDTYQAGFDASWELDLFGKKRRALESATAELKSAEFSRDQAKISVIAEVARTYVDIRRYQEQLRIVDATIASEQTTLKIVKERVDAGTAPGLDAAQVEVLLSQEQAQAPVYRNLLLQAEYSMDVLLGEQPGATLRTLTQTAPIPGNKGEWVLASPATVIAARPDIKVAEQDLAAATAQQGVATAALFPDISLSGFLGVLNSESNNLLQANSKSWSVGSNAVWSILNYGKLTANIDISKAHKQEALLNYQKAILLALSDVERSVSAWREEEKHREFLQQTVAASRKTLDIARSRYKEGLSSFLDVLESERTLFTTESQLAESQAHATQNLIAVYKSLGGGWKIPTEAATVKPKA